MSVFGCNDVMCLLAIEYSKLVILFSLSRRKNNNTIRTHQINKYLGLEKHLRIARRVISKKKTNARLMRFINRLVRA